MVEMTTTKAELLPKIQKGWDDFNAYLKTLTVEQLSVPTDAAGWTAKDHVTHLAAWEDSISVIFEHKPRYEGAGVDKAVWDELGTTWHERKQQYEGTDVPQSVWEHDLYDNINEVIRQLHKNKTWDEVSTMFHASHARLMGKIKALSDADINRPGRDFVPDSSDETPIFISFASHTYEHYDMHRPWIAAIVAG